MAAVIAKALRDQSYAVDIASDGGQAIYTASINTYDFAILDVRLPVVQAFQLRALPERIGDLQADRVLRYQLCHPVDLVQGQVKCPAHIANGGARLESTEGDDLRHAFAAVTIDHILNYFVAPVVGEVHVDIRHLDAFGVQEALERQPVRDRIEI